jgi:phage FluMu protein Com
MTMPIELRCQQCQTRLSLAETLAGKKVKCPRCATILVVPTAEEEPADVEEVQEVDPSSEPALNTAEDEEVERPRKRKSKGKKPSRYDEAPDVYVHDECGDATSLSDDIVRLIASDPFWLLTSTYCASCEKYVGLRTVRWEGTNETMAAFRGRLRRAMHPMLVVLRLVIGPLVGAGIGVAVVPLMLKNDPNGVGYIVGPIIGLIIGYFATGWIFQMCRNPHKAVREALAKRRREE